MSNKKAIRVTISRTPRLFGQKMFMYHRHDRWCGFGFSRENGAIMYSESYEGIDPIDVLENIFSYKVSWWHRKIYKYSFDLVYIDDISHCIDVLDQI